MAEDLPSQDEATAKRAHEQMLQAVDDAIEATKTIADPDRAYAAAKVLVELLRKATLAAGQLHAQTVARIHEQDPVPYSVLARRLGVSRPRAEQLVKLARRTANS